MMEGYLLPTFVEGYPILFTFLEETQFKISFFKKNNFYNLVYCRLQCVLKHCEKTKDGIYRTILFPGDF